MYPPFPPAMVASVPNTEPIIALTPETAVALALKRNPDLAAAVALVEAARGQVAEARAALNPGLTVSGAVTGLDRRQTASITLPEFPTFSFTTAPKDQSQFLVTADLPLDITGQIRAGIRRAGIGHLAAERQEDAARNRIGSAVRDAYFTVLQAQELVRVAEETVANAEERERTAESYVRAGTATRFETLRAATETANARQSLLTAKNRVTLSLAALATTLGIPQTQSVTLAESMAEPGVLPAFEEALAEAERRRPELLAAQESIRSAEVDRRLAAGSDDPTLGVGAQYQHSPRPGFGQARDLTAVSLRLTIPILDRGIRRARDVQAEARWVAARRSYDAVRDRVALEVRQEWLARQEAEERLKVATAAVTQAEEQYRLARNRYRAGVNLRSDLSSPLLEISDAQIALTQARTNLVQSRYDVLRTQARLEGALGRFSRPEVQP